MHFCFWYTNCNGKKYLYEPTLTADFFHNSFGWYNLHYYYYFIISLFNSLFNLTIFFIPTIIYQLNVSSYLYKFHFFFIAIKKTCFYLLFKNTFRKSLLPVIYYLLAGGFYEKRTVKRIMPTPYFIWSPLRMGLQNHAIAGGT